METIHKAQRLKARRYRNRRLGDFLKELEITEGRATGIPTIQKVLAQNGSPAATIETDDERSYFIINIPVRKQTKGSKIEQNKNDENNLRQSTILKAIKNNPQISIAKLSSELGVSIITVKRALKNLTKWSIIKHIGPTNGGYWKIISNTYKQNDKDTSF